MEAKEGKLCNQLEEPGLSRESLELVGRPWEPAVGASEPGGRPGQIRGWKKNKKISKENKVFPHTWRYHRSSSPTGPLPKYDVALL